MFNFTSYKVTSFLVFVVAKILFFSREETYIFWTEPAFTCSMWTMNTEWLKKLYNMFKVNSKDTRKKPIEVVAVSFSVNWTKRQPPEVFYKKAILKNIHRKATVLESLLNKVARFHACSFIKKILQHRCFPVNIVKFFKNSDFKKHQLAVFILGRIRLSPKKSWKEVSFAISF